MIIEQEQSIFSLHNSARCSSEFFFLRSAADATTSIKSMENKGAAMTSEIGQNKGGAESEKAQQDVVLIEDSFSVVDTAQFSVTDPQYVSKVVRQDEPRHSDDPSTEVNMEATINPEDVIRAGGFGARDGISSLLPIASDSTDFEASLLDARDYEEPQGEQRRPGLGWKEDRVSE